MVDKKHFDVNNTVLYLDQLLDEDAVNTTDANRVKNTYYKIPIVWKNIPETTDKENKAISKQVELQDIRNKLKWYADKSFGG